MKPANLTLLPGSSHELPQHDNKRADEHGPELQEELSRLRKENLELQAKLHAATNQLEPGDRSDAGSSVFTTSTDQSSGPAGPKVAAATMTRERDPHMNVEEKQQLTLPGAASATEPR